MATNVKKVLVSGYDLKFWNALQEELEKTGLFEFKRDTLIGNYGHDDKKALELIEWADILIAEWTLNNAVFLSKHKKKHQKLVMRFHLQERWTEYPNQIDYSQVDSILFVGPHILRECIDKFSIPSEICHVVGNFIDMEKYALPKFGDAEFNIGIIGVVPARKRLDLAFETLTELLKLNSSYRLHVKGPSPMDYPWLWKRDEEREYYEDFYEKLNSSEFRNHVIFDPPGSDVNYWLQKIGYILSPSDFESFHVAVSEGVSSSAIPIVWNWEGASEIYPPFQLMKDPKEAAKFIDLNRKSNTRDLYNQHSQDLIREQYSKSVIMGKWKNILIGSNEKIIAQDHCPYKKVIVVYAIDNYSKFHRKEMLDALAKQLKDEYYILIIEPGTHYNTILNNKIDDEISLKTFAKSNNITLAPNLGRIKALYGALPGNIEVDSNLRKLSSQKESIRYFINKFFDNDVKVYHWLYKPDQIKFVKNNESYFYEVYDEYTMDFGTGEIDENIVRLEQDVLAKAEHVFFTSKPLSDRKRHFAKSSSVISNGVVFDTFDKYRVSNHSSLNKRKSVGYLGNLSDFFNWKAVAYFCKELPELDFFFHGQLELKNDLDRKIYNEISALPNTYFSGRVTREQGAAAINRYDALIIPFVINDAMHAVNPLKLWEYFVTGKPVVSSPMDAIKISEPALYIAKSNQDWVIKLKEALLESNDSSIKEQRRDMAKNVSWDILAKKYSIKIINNRGKI